MQAVHSPVNHRRKPPPPQQQLSAAAATNPRGLLERKNTPNCKTKVLFSIKSWSNLQKVTDFWIFSEKSLD